MIEIAWEIIPSTNTQETSLYIDVYIWKNVTFLTKFYVQHLFLDTINSILLKQHIHKICNNNNKNSENFDHHHHHAFNAMVLVGFIHS